MQRTRLCLQWLRRAAPKSISHPHITHRQSLRSMSGIQLKWRSHRDRPWQRIHGLLASNASTCPPGQTLRSFELSFSRWCFGHIDLLQRLLQKELLAHPSEALAFLFANCCRRTLQQSELLLSRLRHDHEAQHILECPDEHALIRGVASTPGASNCCTSWCRPHHRQPPPVQRLGCLARRHRVHASCSRTELCRAERGRFSADLFPSLTLPSPAGPDAWCRLRAEARLLGRASASGNASRLQVAF